MAEQISTTIRYMFILGVILLFLGYYVGANQLFKTGIAGANQLDLTATGRDASGKFAGYAK